MDSTIITDPFIYVADDILAPTKCKEIIDRFEERKEQQKPGETGLGLRTDIKDSTDLKVDYHPDEWKDVTNIFKECVSNLFNQYVSHLSNAGNFYNFYSNTYTTLTPPNTESMMDTGYQIQRTYPGKGYIWHHDSEDYRLLTFIIYLNTVDEGWTQFYTGNQVEPVVGRGLIFPATWTYFHQGYPPKQTKYIMTGWLHEPH